jgi:hypothetical protein
MRRMIISYSYINGLSLVIMGISHLTMAGVIHMGGAFHQLNSSIKTVPAL